MLFILFYLSIGVGLATLFLFNYEKEIGTFHMIYLTDKQLTLLIVFVCFLLISLWLPLVIYKVIKS